ncbi:uncharacterized protein LOC110461190 isoform X2 [Mizuhopecten yessoensis]|uniref:uncharacterized protein LOC110461190 isoform X2 n=1 Tax=Mizuhopecten yessoensis TaxID=6573 RepID=UPI000B4573B5|nr:uncharacterized protein LOC110461190 isoform X2 [Mizuhopecten yessoensis]
MDCLQQWIHVLYFVLLGCISSIPCVNCYMQHNSVYSPTLVPQHIHNIFMNPTMGPPLTTMNPILPTVTPLMPAAVSAISSAYPRQFFNVVPRRRTFSPISVRPVNIKNAIRSPQSTLYQTFRRLNSSSLSKIYDILKNQMGTSNNLPVIQTTPSSRSNVAMNVNSIPGQSFMVMPNTKDLITSEVAQNSVFLQRLVGQKQIGSSTASRLGREIKQMKQTLLASAPAERQTGQQQEQLLLQLRKQLQNQLSMVEPEPAVNTVKNSVGAPSSNGIISSNSLLDAPHSMPLESIDEMFEDMAADSGISFSSDVGPGVFKVEYDMLITQEEMEEKYSPKTDGGRVKRALVKKKSNHWPGGRIPYTIRTRDFSSTERRDIHLALREWESYTCVRFVPATPSDQYKLQLKDSDGCHSYVGKKRKNQMVGLAKPCRKRSIILHEIGHAIGMFHEQARPDRNMYIDILYNHILPPVRFNFQSIDADQTTNYSIPYDYLSIMHYGETAFSFNRTAITMHAKDPNFQKKMGKATRISFRDVMSVNAMYSCSGHCISPPSCPFKEAFVGKDCRCWCPTDQDDREPAKQCPEVSSIAPPRSHTTHTNQPRTRPGQTQQDKNSVLLRIAFNPDRRQSPSEAANAVLRPVGEVHNFIRNPSVHGDRMVPTSGSEVPETLAATLSNLPDSITLGSLKGQGERPSRSRSINNQFRNRISERRSNFRRRQPVRSLRPSTPTSADRLERQLLQELNELNGIHTESLSQPTQSTPLLSGLMTSRQSNGDINTLVNNAMGLISGNRRDQTTPNTNGAVVSSQTPGGGGTTADLRQLLRKLNRLNSQNQMSPHVANVRHTHVNSRSRSADILSQRRGQHLLRELSDFFAPRNGRQQTQQLSADQISFLLAKFPSSPSPDVTHTHQVVVQPSNGHHHQHHHHHHHHHRDHNNQYRQQDGVLSPILDNTRFHSNH